MNLGIVGGGWAGLSAAVALHRQGHKVTVFEAARTLGGRARSVRSQRRGATLDNGQHILLGAYTETLALLQELGLAPESRLFRQPFSLQSADGHFALKAAAWPAPWHLLGALISARGLSIGERFRLIAIIRALQRRQWQTPAGLTVAQWLEQGRQSNRIVRYFWRPLCLAALNTPIDQACARLFSHVLRDSLGGPATAADILIPRTDLSALWIDHLPKEIDIRRGTAIKRLASDGYRVELNGESFDAAVLAGNAYAVGRLLNDLPESSAGAAYRAALSAFDYLPIATLTLELEQPWRLPCPMLMLQDSPVQGQFGQWLFDRSVFMNVDHAGRRDASLTVVISDARALLGQPEEWLVENIVMQIRQQTLRFSSMPGVLGHELIIEKRATFAAVPGLQRPSNHTPWPRVWAAGDWTDTGYPAVLEGAVRSGRNAAALIAKAPATER
jgi:squalene-associated FAD-dependent desaturase